MTCEQYGAVRQEPGLSVEQDVTERLRTSLWMQRVESKVHL